jgi:hypothetical protein
MFLILFAGLLSSRAATEAGQSVLPVARFEQLVFPAVEAALRQPGEELGGEIAWGRAYQLAALVEMLEVTRDSKYAEQFVRLADWVAAARDDRHGLRDEVRNRVQPAWGSTGYSNGNRYVWAVHTGVIAVPMARFAAIVKSDPALAARWGGEAGRLLKVAQEAVGVHADEYREGPGADEGYVYCPYLKKHLPLNMQNALAEAWLAIDDATRTQSYRPRITGLARFLKHRLRTMEEDGSYVWAYWPPLEGTETSFEDISHAAINVDFMVRCFEHELVFTREDLARLEKTLCRRVVAGDDRIYDTVGGTGTFNKYRSAVLRWGRLTRHSPAARETLLRLSRRPEFAQDATSLPLALAYLLVVK